MCFTREIAILDVLLVSGFLSLTYVNWLSNGCQASKRLQATMQAAQLSPQFLMLCWSADFLHWQLSVNSWPFKEIAHFSLNDMIIATIIWTNELASSSPLPLPHHDRRPSKIHNSLIHKDEQHLGLPPYSWSPTLPLLCTRVGDHVHVHTQMYIPLYSQSRHNHIKKDRPYSISSGSTHGIVMITNDWSLKFVSNVCPYLLALIHFFILKSFITTKREYKVIFMLCN